MTELEYKDKQRDIELKNRTLDLIGSQPWKDIIENEYFSSEAIRLINGLGNLQLTRDQRDNMVRMAAGIPALQQFLSRLIGYGNQAETDINEFEKEASGGVSN